MEIQSNNANLTGVVVTGGAVANSLGVVRAFGRRGIPVVYLDSSWRNAVRYSKYITKRLKCPNTLKSENEFIRVLLDFGKQINGRMMIIPTSDTDVLALSRHKRELEKYYHIPVPTFEIAQKFVNKKNFYSLLAKMGIPHPKTFFPESLIELEDKGRKIDYPFIIKPAYSFPFAQQFGRKCFVIHSSQELSWAIDRLRGKNLDVMLQEIIPGKEIYMFYTYLNEKSEALAVCGYDKIRQFPPDFGSGSFCRSNWRSSPIRECILLLKAVEYHGFAEPELKKDPRDGKYKLLEINARTTTENRLTAACGADIEYISYVDASGMSTENSLPPPSDIFWIDDIVDLFSCFMLLKRREIGLGEVIKVLKTPKVHSVAACDDPSPFAIYILDVILQTLSARAAFFRTFYERITHSLTMSRRALRA